MQNQSLFAEFFHSLIDYAGLFPPAALPLAEALKNYSQYLRGADSDRLSHFVVPTAKFSEVTADLSDLFTEEYPLSLSVIPTSFATDIEAILEFCLRGGSSVLLGSIETRFAEDADFVAELAAHSAAHMELPPECIAFYEVPMGADWDEQLVQAINALAATRGETGANVGFKLRCGGVNNSAIPAVERVATAILRCGVAKVPMKFTAGLHHPFRHRDASRGCFLHGFFNLFFAGMVVRAGERSFDELCSIVAESENHTVTVEDGELTWLGHQVSAATLEAARRESVLSFGSCSFSDPINDAKELGWL